MVTSLLGVLGINADIAQCIHAFQICNIGRNVTFVRWQVMLYEPIYSIICALILFDWCCINCLLTYLHAFSALTLLVGQQERHPACKKLEWWDGGMVICLGVMQICICPADATATHYLLLQ